MTLNMKYGTLMKLGSKRHIKAFEKDAPLGGVGMETPGRRVPGKNGIEQELFTPKEFRVKHGHRLFDIKNVKIYMLTISLAGVVSAFCLTLVSCPTRGEPEIPRFMGTVTIEEIENQDGRRFFRATITGPHDAGTHIFQWRRGTENVGYHREDYYREPGDTFLIDEERDIGQNITVIVIRQGYSGAAVSPALTVENIGGAPLSGNVNIIRVGQVLFADASGVDIADNDRFFFQWKRGDNDDPSMSSLIPGANDIIYTLQPADLNRYVFVRVTSLRRSGYLHSTPMRIPDPGQVQDPGVNVTITLSPFVNQAPVVTLPQSFSLADGPITFTASGVGAAVAYWRIGGHTFGPSASVTLGSELGIGSNSITVEAEVGGRTYGRRIVFDVTL